MERINSGFLKQIGLLVVIIFIGIELVIQLKYFIPGFFGAITLYILYRSWFYYLIEKKHWKKWMAALILILGNLLLVVLPVFAIVKVLIPKIKLALNNTGVINAKLNATLNSIKSYFPSLSISHDQMMRGMQEAALYIPKLLNATASVVSNIAVAFFIFYFMLMGSRKMEDTLESFLPLSAKNRNTLWKETKNLVISNAIGIPVLALCQAGIAIIGYWVFGVQEFVLWGLLTGAASIIPVVGTMIVWIPICLIMFINGDTGMAIGLLLFCGAIVANTDNVLRFTLMKKFGDVHPLITVFGVILGLQLFGIMGLIFGPLLISYFLLLLQIYKFEYGRKKDAIIDVSGVK